MYWRKTCPPAFPATLTSTGSGSATCSATAPVALAAEKSAAFSVPAGLTVVTA